MTLLYTGGFGAWSPDGCTEVVTGSGNEKVCECTQLAHFGILFVSVHSYLLCRLTIIALLFCTGSESETTSTAAALALSVLTYVGLSISLLCLFALLVTYLSSKCVQSQHGVCSSCSIVIWYK